MFSSTLSRKPSLLRRIVGEFTSVESATLLFLGFFALLALIFWDSVDLGAIAISIGWTVGVILLLSWANSKWDKKWIHGLYTFYVVPIALMVFKTTEKLSYPIHGHDFDNVLISADRSIFGTDPTVWLYTHIPVLPPFVEFLQICYFMYYWMPVIVAVELFRRKQRSKVPEKSARDLEFLRFTIIYGLLASYVVYLLLPGVGPRFTLHDFASLPAELPGLWLTDTIRSLINWGENISAAMTNIEAMKVVTRDVFPSGHTEITLLTMLLAFKFRVRARWFILLVGSGLIFSTVYLRYHYVIDVVSGALLALIVLYTAEPVMEMLVAMKAKLTERAS